jgi:hypothetical protein
LSTQARASRLIGDFRNAAGIGPTIQSQITYEFFDLIRLEGD